MWSHLVDSGCLLSPISHRDGRRDQGIIQLVGTGKIGIPEAIGNALPFLHDGTSGYIASTLLFLALARLAGAVLAFVEAFIPGLLPRYASLSSKPYTRYFAIIASSSTSPKPAPWGTA